jgi:hypothetical protein
LHGWWSSTRLLRAVLSRSSIAKAGICATSKDPTFRAGCSTL